MASIPRFAAGLKPAGITGKYPYIDKVRAWVKTRLSTASEARLRSLCKPGTVRFKHWPEDFPRDYRHFDRSYRQRLDLNQPPAVALHWLAQRDDVRITYVEVSLDWTFDDEYLKDAAFEFLCQHIVKKHHREQGIRFYRKEDGARPTRYSGPRRAPNVLAIYYDKPCKITGEVDCVHLDWRIKGSQALRRAGLTSLQDLLALDHREFWRSRLLLYALDAQSFGRKYHNARKGSLRRKPWITNYPCGLSYNHDRSIAQVMFHGAGSIQQLIDDSNLNVRTCLISLPVKHLLPATLLYDICQQFPSKPHNPLSLRKKVGLAPPKIPSTATFAALG